MTSVEEAFSPGGGEGDGGGVEEHVLEGGEEAAEEELEEETEREGVFPGDGRDGGGFRGVSHGRELKD